MLGAELTDASKTIFNVVRGVSHYLSTTNSGLGLREIGERVVEVSSNSEKSLGLVNVLAEVYIIDFINISLIHISAKNKLSQVSGCSNLEEVKHSQELGLCNVTIFSLVEVLEQGLKQNASGVNGKAVLFENLLNVERRLLVLKVFSPGEKSILLSHRLDHGGRSLIDSLHSECQVDVVAEINVVEEYFGVVGPILVSKRFEFIICESEVHGR